MQSKTYEIKPFKVSFILAATAASLVFISTAIWYFPTRYKWDVGKFFDLFFVDREKNIPTMFSALILLLCAILIFVIASIRKGKPNSFYPHWIGLGIGFMVMSIDEFVMLHEMLIKPMDTLLGRHRSAFLQLGWVVPGIILVVVLALVYVWFLAKLPRRTLWIFIIAGALYLTGAIALEMVGGYIIKTFGEMTREYVIECTFEESCELFGTVLFIYGLLDYLKLQVQSIHLQFSAPNTELNEK
jgi:hypothetical protein